MEIENERVLQSELFLYDSQLSGDIKVANADRCQCRKYDKIFTELLDCKKLKDGGKKSSDKKKYVEGET